MAPVARWLSSLGGVLEPLQTASTLEGQVEELHEILLEQADLPVILIGWSWGAWLAYICAARYPQTVSKLVLVSSGPFTDAYAEGIMETRLERLGPADRAEAVTLLEVMEGRTRTTRTGSWPGSPNFSPGPTRTILYRTKTRMRQRRSGAKSTKAYGRKPWS